MRPRLRTPEEPGGQLRRGHLELDGTGRPQWRRRPSPRQLLRQRREAAAARQAGPPPVSVSMGELLREALRGPRDLLLMLGALLVAMAVTSPLPTYLWGPVALLLAAIPGTVIMNRVRARAERRVRE